MNIGSAVKENTEKYVECKASSSNHPSAVDMAVLVVGINHIHSIHITQTPGSDNGTVKTFVFTFKTDQSMNGKMAQCTMKWNGIYIAKKSNLLNITCE